MSTLNAGWHPFPSGAHPVIPIPQLGKTDAEFNNLVKDPTIVVNPGKLGFIPQSSWPNQETTLGAVILLFFHKRNSPGCRFSHKLYNALRLSLSFPDLKEFLGIEWLTRTILRVNKLAFARLLKIKAIDGSLFHQQGNFPSHGFVEIGVNETQALSPELLVGVDFDTVRLLKHVDGTFTSECSQSEIENCKWVNCRKPK
jgi:hypothetical protein